MDIESILEKNLDENFLKIKRFINKENIDDIQIQSEDHWYPSKEKIVKKELKFKKDFIRKEKTVYYRIDDTTNVVKVVFKEIPTPSKISYIGNILNIVVPLYLRARRSERDSMTGLYNYNSFKEESVKIIKKVQSLIHQGKTALDIDTEIIRGESPKFSLDISFLHFDIDYFKRINDSLGHRIGDVVLISFTRYLKEFFSNNDFLKTLPIFPLTGRLGGEEFGVLLPFVGEKKGIEVSENCRKYIENIHFPHPDCENDDIPLIPQITISIGVATLDSSVIDSIEDHNIYMSLERLREQSDIATYVAKKLGRNRVVSFNRILYSGGIVLDVDQRTGIITIDLGSSMGVKKGDVFAVYDKEKFTGSTPIIQPGSQRKVVGYFPKISLGNIQVFMTQDQVSFCKKVAGDFYIAPGFVLELKEEGKTFIEEESSGKKFKRLSSFKNSFKEILDHKIFHIGVISVDNFSILKDTKGTQFVDNVKQKIDGILNDIDLTTFLWTYLSESERAFLIPDLPIDEVFDLSEEIKKRCKKEAKITVSIGVYSTEKEIKDSKDFSSFSRDDAINLARITAEIAKFKGGDRVVIFSTPLILERGMFYYRNREYDKAVKEFEKIASLGVKTAAFHSAYAVSLSMLGKFKEALEQDLKALEIEPENPILHRNLALDLIEMEDFQKAVLHLKNVEKSLSENLKNQILKPWMWREYGKALYNIKQYKEAVEKLTRVISIDPTDGSAFYYRGKAYLKMKKEESGRQDILKAISLGYMDIEEEIKGIIEKA